MENAIVHQVEFNMKEAQNILTRADICTQDDLRKYVALLIEERESRDADRWEIFKQGPVIDIKDVL